jgi:hypothetical protein
VNEVERRAVELLREIREDIAWGMPYFRREPGQRDKDAELTLLGEERKIQIDEALDALSGRPKVEQGDTERLCGPLDAKEMIGLFVGYYRATRYAAHKSAPYAVFNGLRLTYRVWRDARLDR